MNGPWSKLLAGKVQYLTLPALTPPFAPDTPPPLLKRLLLPQGELAQCFDGSFPIQYLAWVEMVAGSVRGNHYHKAKVEYFYMAKGEASLHVKALDTGTPLTIDLVAGSLVIIHPGIAHALATKVGGQALEYSPNCFDPADVFPFRFDL